jgi:hypothetical protein
MNEIKFSLCASGIRPEIWHNLLDSLRSNDLKYEVILAGNVKPQFDVSKYPELKYIYSATKPSQCYQICFNEAQGELVSWSADDAIYPPHALDEMYGFFKSFNNRKLVVAFRTVEDGRDITEWHRLRGKDPNAPRMAPFGVMDREFFNELGGYDRNFICGQSENDVVMRVYEAGGELQIAPVPVIVNHQKAHTDTVFRSGYFMEDRKVLENCWIRDGIIQQKRLYPFEPFSKENITEKTQAQLGRWL